MSASLVAAPSLPPSQESILDHFPDSQLFLSAQQMPKSAAESVVGREKEKTPRRRARESSGNVTGEQRLMVIRGTKLRARRNHWEY
jgi:hypothetical protein